jgi:hypothetical protein
VRWSAHYDQTVIFYRDTIGLPVLETFHNSYGLDGTILGLPGGPVHLASIRGLGGPPWPVAAWRCDESALWAGMIGFV